MAYRTSCRRRARRHPVRTAALLVLILLAGGCCLRRSTPTAGRRGLQGSWWEENDGAVSYRRAADRQSLRRGRKTIRLAKNPDRASDFYQDGGYVRCCTASPVSRTWDRCLLTPGGDRLAGRSADAGIEFAIIRARPPGLWHPGSIEEDTQLLYQYRGRAGSGPAGRPSISDSQAITTAEALREEAQFVLNHLGGYEITYPVIFDWEQSSEAGADSITGQHRADRLRHRLLRYH